MTAALLRLPGPILRHAGGALLVGFLGALCIFAALRLGLGDPALTALGDGPFFRSEHGTLWLAETCTTRPASVRRHDTNCLRGNTARKFLRVENNIVEIFDRGDGAAMAIDHIIKKFTAGAIGHGTRRQLIEAAMTLDGRLDMTEARTPLTLAEQYLLENVEDDLTEKLTLARISAFLSDPMVEFAFFRALYMSKIKTICS